ncbi:hypothetical protein BTO06_03395 [Tenacibaculum sp. SZ-18]|uniref:hypothetical protein n=1 Tax=Tenacibaculum sp. SZ-18 TaxID=754423 RepID=UPI000C2D20FA|nr:hypothetical protein [Tenacibaculum sp. SZ-18]AUC14250.1 hypothetical protein BTO06_03395 [Tenacibaculum sp. SZ-18]
MKILKSIFFVLLVGITFSFSHYFPERSIISDNTILINKTTNQENLVTLHFLPGTDEFQKATERDWTCCKYGITLGTMIEKNANYEIWTYTPPPSTTGTNNNNLGGTGSDGQMPPLPCNGGNRVSVQFNIDRNSPVLTFD